MADEQYSSDSEFSADEEPDSVDVNKKQTRIDESDHEDKNGYGDDETVSAYVGSDVKQQSPGSYDNDPSQKDSKKDRNFSVESDKSVSEASDDQRENSPTTHQDQKKKAHFIDCDQGQESDDGGDTDAFELPNSRENTNVSLPQSRQNTESSLLQSRDSKRSGRRHNSSNSHSPPRRPGGVSIRHYTTMGIKDEEGKVKPDAVSLRSQSSRASGFLSCILDYMAERFIYQTDPFNKTIRRCPRVAFQVIERATMPVSVESLFGSQEKRALPSYYYTSTDKHSAKPKRGASGVGSSRRSSSSQSNSIADYKSLPPVDSPRNSAHGDMFRLEDFIPEEDENSNAGIDKARPTVVSGKNRKTKRDGNLPNIMVSDHSLSRKNSANRPITSSSSKTTKSLGLPGKPLRA